VAAEAYLNAESPHSPQGRTSAHVAAFCIHDRLFGVERFRARFALAAFLDLLGDSLTKTLPWGPLTLSTEAPDELAERAEASLNA
jgi:hypothetical protein